MKYYAPLFFILVVPVSTFFQLGIGTTTTDVSIAVYRIDNGDGVCTTDLDIKWMAWE